MSVLRRLLEALGLSIMRFVEATGLIVCMGLSFFAQVVRPPYRITNIFYQMERVGVRSLTIVGITGLFTGMVFAVQLYMSLSLFGAGGLVGAMVGLSLTRELSPVFCALMVTGRVGSAMAATLGTMRVTEQIDALEAMAVHPVQYLVVPRVLAATLMMPLLVVTFVGIGLVGAYGVSNYLLHIDPGTFFNKLYWFVDPDDVWKGALKGAFFGFIFSVVGCARGYHTQNGAEGVGRSTTEAVVIASVLIFIADYFLTEMMW